MKLVYTNESLFLLTNAQNILQAQRIEVIVKNEFAHGAIGEISTIDCWPQLWIVNERDYDKGDELIANLLSKQTTTEWICNHCHEKNAGSFELCWQCQSENI